MKSRSIQSLSGLWRAAQPTAPMLSLGRLHSIALALLVTVALAAVYGVYRVAIGGRIEDQIVMWSTCGMLVSLAICMLLLGRYVMQRSLGHVEERLRVLSREDRLDPLGSCVPPELAAVMEALEEYVGRVRVRVERLRIQKQELDLQMRMAEAERRHTEAMIFSISDAVLVIDTFGELVLANAAAEKLFGFSFSDWRRRPIESIVHDAELVGLIRDVRCSIEPGLRREVEYTTTRGDRTHTYIVTLSRVVDSDGQTHGVVAVFHDITHEREIAQVRTDFVSAVSHELRTPLSSIKAYVEMLQDGEARNEDDRRQFLEIIAVETERLQRLIDKVLDISRIESGVMDVRMTEIAPHDVIREVLDMMAPQAASRQITLRLDAGPDVGLVADRDLFYQAVQNVISNAIKYTPQGGEVAIRTDLTDDRSRLAIRVSDTGIGIRPEDLPRIFQKFFRSREGAAIARGTGLGLNLVKQIVETVHDGRVSVSSQHGAGTTVVLEFPLSRLHGPEPRKVCYGTADDSGCRR